MSTQLLFHAYCAAIISAREISAPPAAAAFDFVRGTGAAQPRDATTSRRAA